jgi:hypothetical protein
VELYLYTTSGPSWPVIGWPLPLLYFCTWTPRYCHFDWRGYQHEYHPWTKTDMPFGWLESHLVISRTQKHMILKPTNGHGRKLASPQ